MANTSFILDMINQVAPSIYDVQLELAEIKRAYPTYSNRQIAEIFNNRIIKNYTSIGVASALPSIIPGVGTLGQVAIEAASVSGDLMLLLRWVARLCYGNGLLAGNDMKSEFSKDMIVILGLWSGVIIGAKEITKRMGTKVATAQFNKHVSKNLLQKINQKVGTTILTKYGTKRGGMALGRLIPFGIGALVGGVFNNNTMKKFSAVAMNYYGSDKQIAYELVE